MQKYTFFVPIYGVTFNGQHRLGEFTLCDKNYFLSGISNNLISQKVNTMTNHNCFLSFEINNDDKKVAEELANSKAVEFKRLMDYCCGRNNKIPAVNLQEQPQNGIKYFFTEETEDSVYFTDKMNNNFIPREHTLDELIVEMINNNTSYVWELYSKSSKSDKENRIVNAVLWIGKAQTEIDNNIYFMELCFALESLLQIDTDKFVNPSITYSIATNCAMIIADDYNDRQKVFDKIKKLYSIRSKIAHGKQQDHVNSNDCETLYMFLAYLLNDLVHKDKWKKYNSMQELLKEIEAIKLGKNEN